MNQSQETALKFKRRRFRSNISKYDIEHFAFTGDQFVAGAQQVATSQQYEGAIMQHYNTQLNNQNTTLAPNNTTQYTPESAAQQRQDSAAKIVSSLNNNAPKTPRRPVSGEHFNFTMEDYLRGNRFQHTKEELPAEHYKNAKKLIEKINSFGQYIKYNDQINSSYRTPAEQRLIAREQGKEPAMQSKHLSGHAIDINDPNGELKQQIRGNKEALLKAQELGLYFENFSKTNGWVHIQDEAPGFTGDWIWAPEDFLYGNKIRYPVQNQQNKNQNNKN